MSQEKTPVVACLKWGKGYPTVYTNVLYRALTDLMGSKFRFVCITDHADGLDDGIETIDLPDFALETEQYTNGMWPKLSVFHPDFFEPGTPVLMMDVDMVITKDISPLFDKIRSEVGLHIIYDWHDTHERWFPSIWNRPRMSNSSVVGFIAGEQSHLWESFKDETAETLFDHGENDQVFIHKYANNLHHWPAGWVLSFKKSLAWHFPTSLFLEPSSPPDSSFIVAFHGSPDPEECAQKPFKRWGSAEKFGFFPVSWVKRYWNKYNA